jgi:hypothetical protein
MDKELASETSYLFKKLYNGQSPKKKTVSFNFSHGLFSPLCAQDGLVMQALV